MGNLEALYPYGLCSFIEASQRYEYVSNLFHQSIPGYTIGCLHSSTFSLTFFRFIYPWCEDCSWPYLKQSMKFWDLVWILYSLLVEFEPEYFTDNVLKKIFFTISAVGDVVKNICDGTFQEIFLYFYIFLLALVVSRSEYCEPRI